MRVLIVHHGLLPAPDRPATGGALRAWHHGRALEGAGHEVHWLTRAQDSPGGVSSPADLYRRARALAPERVVCVQPEDAPALAALDLPLAIDLYAPRLLEAPFEGTLADEAVHTLRALARGDVFLVSNARQRHAWLGVMALAGLDVRTDPTLVVPLVAPEGPGRRIPSEPHLVAGGATWPWQDPRPALTRVLAVLDRHGKGRVTWFGGAPLIGCTGAGWALPEHPRLRAAGWVSRGVLLAAYAGATAAIDWMEENPERELAMSFRHADYLGCGLPIMTGENTALADIIGDAGWASSDIEAVMETVLSDRGAVKAAGEAARKLARERLGLEQAEAPLVAWVTAPVRHPRARGPLVDAAEHAARAATAEARLEAAEAARARAETEVVQKRQESLSQTVLVQQLSGTVERLARAVDEVAGFKREAITILGGQAEHADAMSRATERELGILRADLAKKTAELHAMDQLRERLENDVQGLREELARTRRLRR